MSAVDALLAAAEAEVRVRDEAGKCAREEALMLDRLVETLRLASFRTYLTATVNSMSALVPAVLELVGSDVPSALQRIRPSHSWPSITKLENEYGRTGPATNRRKKVAGRFVTRPAPLMGDAVITCDALGDWVEAAVFGGSLDVSLRGDCFQMSTQDGTGYVRYAGTLVEAAGRSRNPQLAAIVSLLLLTGMRVASESGKADEQVFGGKSVADWDATWEHVPNGFKELQTNLRWVPGLFAAKSSKGIEYIGAATQKQAGLRAGLARARLKLQSGNSSHGMQSVRAAEAEVEPFILRMEPPITPEEIVALKWALIDLHKPPMNASRNIVTEARKAAYTKSS